MNKKDVSKKHFIFLGRVGLIYYSWLFIILFIGLIVAYEGMTWLNLPAIILIVLFLFLLTYTLLNSYWCETTLKLPFKKKMIASTPTLIGKWTLFKFYKVEPTSYQTYYLVRIEK